MTHSAAIEKFLRLSPVMPVVTFTDPSVAVHVARALVRGGIRVIEVTLRTPVALHAIELIAKSVPEITVGAGTVLSVADLKASAEAGAAFAISPGSTDVLLTAGTTSPIPYLPAIATASRPRSVRLPVSHRREFQRRGRAITRLPARTAESPRRYGGA